MPKTSSGEAISGRLCRSDKQADAEKGEDDADLEGNEHAGECGGNAPIGFEVDGDGRGLEKALACFGVHIGEQFLVAAEVVDEFSVHLSLHGEDASPAAIFEQDTDEPDQGSERVPGT